MKSVCFAALAAFVTFVAPASAQYFHDENVSIQGNLCVGLDCVSGEGHGAYDMLKLDANNLRIQFKDTSTGSFPNADWRILINDTYNGGANYFAIGDSSTGGAPFKLLNNAPSHSLVIADDGDIGVGTLFPLSELHVTGSYPEITFEDTTNSRHWLMHAANNYYVKDVTNNNIPFHIGGNAPNYSLRIQGGDGDVGLGTFSPEGKLHTKGDGHQIVYFESADNNAVQVRFRTDSQNRRFLATNSADQVQSQLIFRNRQVRIAGPTDSGADLYAIFGPAGLVTRGPVCNPGPCDKVFDPAEFEVPTIEDHAAYMWENQHLWAVGPTSPDEPFNLTQKAGGMLHELEVAHIYIENLHQRLEAQDARLAELERAMSRELPE